MFKISFVLLWGEFSAYTMCMPYSQLLADINSPKKKWGPADPENRGHRYKLDDFDVEITVEANKDKVS